MVTSNQLIVRAYSLKVSYGAIPCGTLLLLITCADDRILAYGREVQRAAVRYSSCPSACRHIPDARLTRPGARDRAWAAPQAPAEQDEFRQSVFFSAGPVRKGSQLETKTLGERHCQQGIGLVHGPEGRGASLKACAGKDDLPGLFRPRVGATRLLRGAMSGRYAAGREWLMGLPSVIIEATFRAWAAKWFSGICGRPAPGMALCVLAPSDLFGDEIFRACCPGSTDVSKLAATWQPSCTIRRMRAFWRNHPSQLRYG
jgi:hypothetical protein